MATKLRTKDRENAHAALDSWLASLEERMPSLDDGEDSSITFSGAFSFDREPSRRGADRLEGGAPESPAADEAAELASYLCLRIEQKAIQNL